MGFKKTVTIHLQNNAAVMHPVQTDLREVKDSVEVILLDIDKKLKRSGEKATKKEGGH